MRLFFFVALRHEANACEAEDAFAHVDGSGAPEVVFVILKIAVRVYLLRIVETKNCLEHERHLLHSCIAGEIGPYHTLARRG